MQAQSLGREDPLEQGVQGTPVLLLGEFHGQRSLVEGCKELDLTEVTFHACKEEQMLALLDKYFKLIFKLYSKKKQESGLED